MKGILFLFEKIKRRYRRKIYRQRFESKWCRKQNKKDLAINGEHIFFYDGNSKDFLVKAYKSRFEDKGAEELEAAEHFCRNRFEFLGHRFEFGEEIQWNLDPVSGKQWDDGFFLDIVYKGGGRLGDIKLGDRTMSLHLSGTRQFLILPAEGVIEKTLEIKQ